MFWLKVSVIYSCDMIFILLILLYVVVLMCSCFSWGLIWIWFLIEKLYDGVVGVWIGVILGWVEKSCMLKNLNFDMVGCLIEIVIILGCDFINLEVVIDGGMDLFILEIV